MTIEPADASILTASDPVPVEDKRRLASCDPETPILKSSASPSADKVKFDATPEAPIVIAPLASTSTPPAPASISIPPMRSDALIFIALLVPSLEEIFTDEPVATISISSPAAAPLAKISIPPAVALILTASAPVPVEDKRRLTSFAPVKEIVRSSASASVALVNPLAYIFASPSCAAYTVVTSELPIVTVFCPLPVAPAPITVSSLTSDAEGTV